MRRAGALPLLFLVGCGSTTPAVEEPKAEPAPAASASPSEDAAPAAKAAPPAQADGGKVPDACASADGSGCVMPKAFVARLCAKVYPELALYFFQKGSPWRRAYVAVRESAPFNGFGGPSADEKLVFDEELLVVSEKKVDTGGMQVSGAGASFDALRWDGTCVTVSAEEVRLQAPPKPKHATIPWRILEDATQDALKQHEALAAVVIERKKECKGATMGSVSAKCEKADRRLNELVVQAVRGGTTVPVPAKVP